MDPTYQLWKVTAGVVVTLGLYSVLYRETKVYRFFEHLFLGLAAGFSIVAIWTETLSVIWWSRLAGSVTPDGVVESRGYWLYALLLPIGLMGYMVFSQKNNWMSRIPIGMLLGFGSGQVVQVWWNHWGPAIYRSMLPVTPTTWDSFTRPPLEGLNAEQAAEVLRHVYPTQAISNIVFVFTILAVLSYFFFSFDIKNKVLLKANGAITTAGRWMLMVGFGAIFGATVMARFALVIDRMAFIWIEGIRDGWAARLGGG